MSRRIERILSAILLLAALAALLLLARARAETISGDQLRIAFQTSILPKALPRSAPVPISLRVTARVRPVGSESPATLNRLTIEVNRHVHFDVSGLPTCAPRRLRGTDSQEALANCRAALVGSGYFTSHIEIPEEAPFPAFGRVLAFNALRAGRPALVLHVFGQRPTPTVAVLSASLSPSGPATGAFGPRLQIEMPRIGDKWGYLTGFGLTFHRRFRFRGLGRSVISANCPAPQGVAVVPFKAARGTFEFDDGRILTGGVGGSCRATG